MEKLTFSHNWNNKLDCKAFTTLRLRNDRKYHKGQELEIIEKRFSAGEFSRGTFIIAEIKHLKIYQINEFIARLDTGFNREECITLIQTMYKKSAINWNEQDLSLILLIKAK